ncbi:hypothetical protein [Tautonia sociabilis]|uniref:Mechanosensitive ion channel MscS porin domain-containing protein n=1 Tax=Tautonia sociabilis TaxID=2080755 RepID=A0A432MDS1_9BACT|nr:hypothetical protein [Tautonia sociabilis]RUL83082.1 hypothetical protein TsocGM_22850 [Tautonia sociabilis]
MRVDLPLAPLLSAILVLGPAAFAEDDPAPDEAPASADLAEDIAALEAMLRVRESRVIEASRFLDLETDVLKTAQEQHQSGATPPRAVELVEVRHASAKALLEARKAERDELRIRLESLRRLRQSPSPERDRAELRQRLEDDVRIQEARLNAREARLAAAEAQVTSEIHSRDKFIKAVQSGTAAVGAARQALFRVAEATTWRDTMAAERDVTRLQRDRARRRLEQFDDPGSADPGPSLTDPEELADRVSALEHTVEVLRDEMYHMQWELQIFRNMQHERFGFRDRGGTPPTVLGPATPLP